jgi:hypothetical protein
MTAPVLKSDGRVKNGFAPGECRRKFRGGRPRTTQSAGHPAGLPQMVYFSAFISKFIAPSPPED